MRILRTLLLTLYGATALFAQCTVSGVVTDLDGKPLSGGAVTLTNEQTLRQVAVGIGDSTGVYRSPDVPCAGPYTISVVRPGYVTYLRQRQQLDPVKTATTMDVVLTPEPSWIFSQPVGAIVLTGIFFITLIFFRWHNIALLDQKQLEAEVAITQTRLKLEADLPARSAEVVELSKELTAALAPFVKCGTDAARNPHGHELGGALKGMDFLFWTRGQEIASWMRVREVQRLLIDLWPPHSVERLRAGLQTAEQTLRTDTSAAGVAMGQLIRERLSVVTPDDKEEERWKQLLLEATSYINVAREESYTAITVWQSKAAWLALTACVSIIATVAARGGGMLFLSGAVGGFMSRLARALKATDTPTDYGASWNTLFLSPLLGSLAGFFGVLMIQGLGTGGALTEALTNTPLALPALAFLLGFSERLFDSLVTALDKQQPAAQSPPLASQAAPQPVSGTTVQDVQPSPALPGEMVVVTGKGLEPSRVEGVALTAQDKSNVVVDNVVQEPEQIRFNLPRTLPNGPALPDGSYILSVKVKDSPFISKTVRVHQMPVVTNPPELTAGTAATLNGAGLDSAIAVELLDPQGKPVSLPDLKQTPAAITFTAPATPGTYKLVLRLGNRNPVEVQLLVKAAAV